MCGYRPEHADCYNGWWIGPWYRREQGSDKSFRVFTCPKCNGGIAWRDDDQLVQTGQWQKGIAIG